MDAKAYVFLKEIKQYVDRHGMLKWGDGVVAGVSGGADSMCLLHILCALRQEYGLSLFVLHVNHGIRGADADADQEFVRRECEKLSVPFKAVQKDVPAFAAQWGCTQEEAGRRVRYLAFHRQAEDCGYKKIAVAHNENDNAETFLFQAMRGSGVWGLAGIAPIRQEEGHTIIRPLLCVSRGRITEFLAGKGQAFCTDITNNTGDYTRNRIRNELLPAAVEMVNSGAIPHLAQAAAKMYELAGFLRGQVEEAYYKAAEETLYNTAAKAGAGCMEVVMEISSISALPEFLRREVVMYALGRVAGSRRDMTGAHVEAVLSLITRKTGGVISLPCGLFAKVSYGRLQIGTGRGMEDTSFLQMGSGEVFEIVTYPKSFVLGNYELSLRLMDGKSVNCGAEDEKNSIIARNCYTKCFDYGTIENILVLRTRQPGDYLYINGGQNRKRLKNLLVDEKVPVNCRAGLPLLTAGSHVLWAVGVRSTEGFRVTGNTKQILVAELKKKGQELQWQKR